MEFNIIVHLIDGSIIKTRKIDFYNNGNGVAFTDQDGKKVITGTKFINKIESI